MRRNNYAVYFYIISFALSQTNPVVFKENVMKKIISAIILMFVCVVAVGYAGYCNTGDSIGCGYVSDISNSPFYANTLDEDQGVVETKLFGIFDVEKTPLSDKDQKEVYLGGMPLGLSLGIDGLMVTAKSGVVTQDGAVSPCENTDIRSGDILKQIDGKKVSANTDITKILNSKRGADVTLTLQRGDSENTYTITPAKDVLSGNYRIGLSLQDSIAGIGTMTFINPENMRYASLGHAILLENGSIVPVKSGSIYNAYISGCVKGKVGKAGELCGTFSVKTKSIGTLDKNCTFGNYGTYTGSTKSLQLITLGGKNTVKPGKAQIYSTVDGSEPQLYDIEIIKVNTQNTPKDKSMVIRITDEKLISVTGGIVQGMSGSPIIQNGKLVGAVTHVFTADPTKGYGVFADWMIMQ